MTLPPGFLDELRSRLSLGQVVGRKVSWDLRKSNQSKGDLWAPCPFHEERTASFHVDDRKGFYYCFGCHAKGDAIDFVRETESVSFIEAIEILAREAGLTMPARDPQAQAKADRQTRLAEVMEAAVRHYRMLLGTRPATAARAYLAGRGLDASAEARFEIGYAPPDRQGIWQHLTAKGIEPDLIVDAGLCARPEDGGAPYDRFRDRILFPIRDARGRAIALGGRAMDPQARAKYLNSPETDLFDKGRTLYNLGPAREAAARGAALVVAEGYMDVIALVGAGFEASVAPLGTAVTEAQLQMLWRLHPEPCLALDGDRAGLRAAMRVIDLALPHLEPGRTLRFAILPDGRDPDDLIRAEGAEAMRAAIDGAEPLSRMLWRREAEAGPLNTPERCAGFEQALSKAVRAIRDPSVRRHYEHEFKRLQHELFGFSPAAGLVDRPGRSGWIDSPGWERGARRDGGRPRGATRGSLSGRARPSTLASVLASPGEDAEGLREAVVLAALIVHPRLFDEFEGEIEAVEFSPATRALGAAVLGHRADRAACEADLGHGALETLLSQSHVRLTPAVRRPDDIDAARACLRGELAKLAAYRGYQREIEEFTADLETLGGDAPEGAGESATWRLKQAVAERERAERAPVENGAAIEIAENGVSLDRDELARSRSSFEGIDYGRGGRAPKRRWATRREGDREDGERGV